MVVILTKPEVESLTASEFNWSCEYSDPLISKIRQNAVEIERNTWHLVSRKKLNIPNIPNIPVLSVLLR